MQAHYVHSSPLPYSVGLALQRRFHREIVAGIRPDTLILLEHTSVYTAGRLTRAHELPTNGEEVIPVDRGGRLTWHGPGQLVGYPIVRLSSMVDAVGYIRLLEQRIISVLANFGIEGMQVAGRSGVWVASDSGESKIAAIGIRVERGVTLHGFAINVNCDLSAFASITPCGISDAGVTTMERISGNSISVSDVVPEVLRAFEISQEHIVSEEGLTA